MRLQDIILSHTLLSQTSSPSGHTNFTDFRRTRCRVRMICNAECSCAPMLRLVSQIYAEFFIITRKPEVFTKRDMLRANSRHHSRFL